MKKEEKCFMSRNNKPGSGRSFRISAFATSEIKLTEGPFTLVTLTLRKSSKTEGRA